MKKSLLVLPLALLTLTACQSGPKRLTRSWDDWVNQKYTENAWVHGALLQDVLPVYPLVGLIATIGDTLFVNPYYFWAKDAWDSKGTGFTHEPVEGTEKVVAGSGLGG